MEEKLGREFPCRSKQISSILEAIEGDEQPPSTIIIHGPPAVGKTSILRKCMERAEVNFVCINCIESYTGRLLFETILHGLYPNLQRDRCDNFLDFMICIKNLVAAERKPQKNIIILDDFENLYDLGEHLIQAFIRLRELTGSTNLCVIFISHIIPEKFSSDAFFLSIHFPQYTKDETFQILSKERPEGYSDKDYQNYLNAALSVFWRTTRDLNETKALVSSCFTKYCDPVKKGLVHMNDVRSLWRHITPHLRSALSKVYLGAIDGHSPYSTDLVSDKVLMAFDLPYYAKYFLVAAYLASYNSAKHDKRLFVKNHGKQRKKLSQKQTKGNRSSELLGPKTFSLDRLLAIFYAIMEDRASLTANLITQVSSLVELKFLSKVGEGFLGKPKFKCSAKFECVDAVARTLGFNLKKYLMD